MVISSIVVLLVIVGVAGVALDAVHNFDDWALIGGAIGIILANGFGLASWARPPRKGRASRPALPG